MLVDNVRRSRIFYAAAADGAGRRVAVGAPEAVSARAVNSTALAISWQPPARAAAAPARWVAGYRVVVSPARLDPSPAASARPPPPAAEVLVPAAGPPATRTVSVVVGGLGKFRAYSVSVTAVSAGGRAGPPSDAIVAQTDEDGTRATT